MLDSFHGEHFPVTVKGTLSTLETGMSPHCPQKTTWTSLLPWDICCFCSAAQSCPTLCDAMKGSMPGFPVLPYLLEFAY